MIRATVDFFLSANTGSTGSAEKTSRKTVPLRDPEFKQELSFENNLDSLYLHYHPQGIYSRLIRQKKTSGFHLWVLGECRYRDTEMNKSVERFAQDLAAGNESLSETNGHFLLFWFRESDHTWHFVTDRFGTMHAYYSETKKGFTAGSFFPAVFSQARNRTLDHDAVTSFFSLGFFPADRTWGKDVHIFRPAHHYTFNTTNRTVEKKRYWNWSFRPDASLDFKSATEEFSSLFSQVVAEQTGNERVAFPLSGGLDSRSTLAALGDEARAMKNLTFFSYGYREDSQETTIAAKLAEAAGIPLRKYSIEPYLFQKEKLVSSCTECFHDVTQARQAYISGELERFSDFILAAHWGDVWLDDMGFLEMEKGTDPFPTVYQKLTKEGREWLLENYLKKESTDAAAGILESEFEAYKGLGSPDFAAKAFKTDQWSFRWTLASLRMYQTDAFPRLPFYDTRIADLISKIPPEHFKKRKLQIEYLKKTSPMLSRVTWQQADANLYFHSFQNSLLLPKRAVKKLGRMLSGKPVIQRNWEVQFLSEEGVQFLRERLLKKNSMLHDYFPPNKIAELLDNFASDPYTQKRGYAVCMLLTFSYALNLLFSGDEK